MVPISTELILKTIVLQWLQTGVFFVNTRQKASKTSVFDAFFAAKTLKRVWVKMWVNRLTHTVTHTGKCSERAKDERTEKPLF